MKVKLQAFYREGYWKKHLFKAMKVNQRGCIAGFLACILATLLGSCETFVADETPNPFAQLPPPVQTGVPPPDSASFEGIHQFILQQRCALKVCHDGSFEPDFRTVQSAYSTLVYHPVLRKDFPGEFDFRVLPFQPERSWLMQRLTTEDQSLGRMPLFMQPLSERELEYIRNWIKAGAPDAEGKLPAYPNLNPLLTQQTAYNQDAQRIDPLRVGEWNSPFIVRPGWNVELRLEIKDDSTSTAELRVNEVRFSYDKDDFSQAKVYEAQYYRDNWRRVFFRARDFEAEKTVYYRIYVQDDAHQEVMEYPTQLTRDDFKLLHSFVIKK